MIAALELFEFTCEVLKPKSGVELGHAVFTAIEECEPGDLLVVVVVGHGDLSKSRDLHVVGPDGKMPRETRVVDWVKEAENRPDGPHVLFFVDVCFAGEAARAEHQLKLESPARSTVFTACAPNRAAYDGLFTKAAAQVLDKMGRKLAHVPAEQEYIPLTTVHADIYDQLNALVEELDANPQEALSSLVEFRTAANPPPFFRNPAFDEIHAAAAGVGADPGVSGILAEVKAIDPLHYETRAAGHSMKKAGCFTGRTEKLKRLAHWLDGEADEPGDLRVVVGSPGSGKSALLGMVACAAFPALRDSTERIWTHATHKPALNDQLAIVHARQRSPSEIFEALARQLKLAQPVDGWDRQSFSAALAGLSYQPVLLVDALDEAVNHTGLAADLLALVQERRCRLLAGLRPWQEFRPLLDAAGSMRGLLNLDEEDRPEVRENIGRYVDAVLELTAPYNSLAYAAARKAFAEAVAETLSADPAKHGERWGEFLVAAIYTHRFAARDEPVKDPALARTLGLATPRTLPDLMTLDLADQPELRAVLTVLGYARGEGMPVEIVRKLVPLFGSAMTDERVRAALSEARFYLRQSIEADGTTLLYRPFHQGLIEHLRSDRSDGDILDALAPTGIDWAQAPAYVRRHAVQHAAAANRVAELLDQAEFLVHSDPAITLPVLAALPEVPIGGHVLRASAHRHATLPPEVRRQILAVDAARFRDPQLVRELLPDAPWHPAWATGSTVSPALLMTFLTDGHSGGHSGPDGLFSAMGTLRGGDGGSPMLAINTPRGVRLWDLEQGQRTGPRAGFGGENVTALCCARTGARTGARTASAEVVITGHEDGSINVWNPWTGVRIRSIETGHSRRVSVLASAEVDGTAVLVSSAGFRMLQLWDLATGEPREEPLAQIDGWLTTLACTTVGRPMVVGTDSAGVAHAWSLESGRSLGLLGTPGLVFKRVCCAAVNGQAVAVLQTRDRRIWLWNLVTGESYELVSLAAEDADEITSMTAYSVADAVVVITGEARGTLRRIGPGSARAVWSTAAHDRRIVALDCAELAGRQVITSADEAGRVCLWNAAVSMAATDPTEERLEVHEIAAVPGMVAIQTGARTLRMHDARTGSLLWEDWLGRSSPMVGLPEVGQVVTCAWGPLSFWDSTGEVARRNWGARELSYAFAQGSVGGQPVLAYGSPHGQVEVVDIATGAQVSTFKVAHSSILDLDIHEVGNRSCLIAVAADSRVRIVDPVSARPVPYLFGDAEDVTTARGVRVAGRHVVVTGHRDGAVMGRNLLDGSLIGSVRQDGPVMALECIVVGDRPVAVTSSTDSGVSFWDLLTWQRITTFAMPEPVKGIAVSSDGVAVAIHGDVVMLRHSVSQNDLH